MTTTTPADLVGKNINGYTIFDAKLRAGSPDNYVLIGSDGRAAPTSYAVATGHIAYLDNLIDCGTGWGAGVYYGSDASAAFEAFNSRTTA